jgi:hypothetical protein
MKHAIKAAIGTAGLVYLLHACTPAQQVHARTALELSMCIQTLVLEHLDEDLKDPIEAAELAIEIAAKCQPPQEQQ